jgi:hypothetical protein
MNKNTSTNPSVGAGATQLSSQAAIKKQSITLFAKEGAFGS